MRRDEPLLDKRKGRPDPLIAARLERERGPINSGGRRGGVAGVVVGGVARCLTRSSSRCGAHPSAARSPPGGAHSERA